MQMANLQYRTEPLNFLLYGYVKLVPALACLYCLVLIGSMHY